MEKRILIIGSPGSGKSTLAHHLHKMYGIPYIIWISSIGLITKRRLVKKN